MDKGMDHSGVWELVEGVSKFRPILLAVLSVVACLSVWGCSFMRPRESPFPASWILFVDM
jgi:hypothetical protein